VGRESEWVVVGVWLRGVTGKKERKGRVYSAFIQHLGKAEHLYSALHGTNHSKALRHGLHSLPANYTMPAFPS